MSYFTESFSAGEIKSFDVTGRFFALIECVNDVTLRFWKNRILLDEKIEKATSGVQFEYESGFDKVEIISAAAQLIEFVCSNGKLRISESVSIVGGVNIKPTQSAGASTHAAVTVTTTSAVILAANANRKYLLVQNRSSTGTIYLNLNGATATNGTGGNGIEILPKSSYENNSVWVSTAGITAIGSIASNPDVLVVEGE